MTTVSEPSTDDEVSGPDGADDLVPGDTGNDDVDDTSAPETAAGTGGGDDGSGPLPPSAEAIGRARRRRYVRSLITGVLAAAVLAVILFVGLGSSSGSTSSAPAPIDVGSKAPDFTLPQLDGGTPVNLAALGSDRGRPVVLNFFASWCIPCQQETPLLASTASHLAATGSTVQFVGVDVNDPTADAQAFVRQSGITYPVGVDQNLHVTAQLYALNGQPNTFFINSKGVVVAHKLGALNQAELTKWLALVQKPG